MQMLLKTLASQAVSAGPFRGGDTGRITGLQQGEKSRQDRATKTSSEITKAQFSSSPLWVRM